MARLLLAFFAILLPLAGFGALANDVLEGGGFAWDEAVLRFARAHHGPSLDRAMLALTQAGRILPLLVLGAGVTGFLAWRRRFRSAFFFALATAGAGALNAATKALFQRPRPDLWVSLAPEHTFSFPSGHAMGTMAFAVAFVCLGRRLPERLWTALLVLPLAMAIGGSRIYLGVHHPSDILAGWLAAVAWVIAVWLVVHHPRWERPTPA